jgi:hypothetical protein
MTPKYVLIFAKTPYSKTPYDLWLNNTGITPLILTTDEAASGYKHLPHVYSFSNYDRSGLVEKTAYALAQKFAPIAVFARAEADVIRAAQLREMFAIQGQTVTSAWAYRHKVLMKTYLTGLSIETPKYSSVRSTYDVVEFIEKNGYPAVIKPVSESGSFGTNILNNESDLCKYLANPYPGDTEIESFVDGEMYHVDGLIQNGEITFICASKYVNDCLSFRKNCFLGSYLLDRNNPLYDRLTSATKAVVAALPAARNMAFHAEFWHTPHNRIVFCEIASRTGGAVISTVVEHKHGLNIDREWLLAECGLNQPFDLANTDTGGWVVIPPKKGILKALPRNLPSFIRHAQYCGEAGQRFNGGVKSGLFLAGYVIAGHSETDCKENVIAAANWFSENTIWQTSEE